MFYVKQNAASREAKLAREAKITRSSTIPVEYGLPANPFRRSNTDQAQLRTCASMPLRDDGAQEIKRTASGGYNFFRKRSTEKQEEVSRARAHELSVLFESSDIKSCGLQKEMKLAADTCSPSLSGMAGITPQMAAAAFASTQSEKVVSKAKTDPLLTKHERRKQAKKEERLAKAMGLSLTGGSLSRPPLTDKSVTGGSAFEEQQQQPSTSGSNINKSSKVVPCIDTNSIMPESVGMEVYPSTPGNFSVTETVAETPSPTVHGSVAYAPKYPLRNIC